MDSNGKRQLPQPRNSPAEDPPVMGDLSLPARKRWRDCFLAIREDINLQASFFRRIFGVQIEQTVRRVVREELARVIYYSNLPPRPLLNQNNQMRYKLVFRNNIKSPIFTTDKIEGKHGEPIEIAIYDTYEQKFISPENPLSSAKLKIVTLDAEHWKNEKEIWSLKEFKNSILSNRTGKEPILSGETNFRLENGVKFVGDLVVRDNSKWTKSGFRLGVIVENGNERVLEGISEPFRVKDRRGKASQKPDQLLLGHNVQCLRKIGKDRALILENNNINTVHHFLWYYHNEQAQLRQILGIKSESDKGWRTIVGHAMECDAQFYAYYDALNYNGFDNQNTHLNPNAHQMQFAPPNNNNYESSLPTSSQLSPSTIDEVNNQASSNLLVTNVPLTSGPHFVGSSSSQSNPCEHNIITQGESSNHMEDIFATLESTSNNRNLFRADSFNPSQCDELIQDYIASMSNNVNNVYVNNVNNMNANNVYEGPLTPRKKAKIMAIIKWVTLPARKRARLAPPVHQTGVYAA